MMTNISIPTSYPHFVANQVLTQDQLNNLRNYLDQQNRLTRVRLIGAGIVCGLHGRVENSELVISDGFGLTSEGYLIQIPAPSIVASTNQEEGESVEDFLLRRRTYTHIRNYVDPETDAENDQLPKYAPWQNGTGTGQITIQELVNPTHGNFLEQAGNPTIALTLTELENKTIFLYIEKTTNELKSCFTTDCNNKGEEVQFNIRVVLVPTNLVGSTAHLTAPESNCNPSQELVQIPRLYAGLRVSAGIGLAEVNTVAQIRAAYRVNCTFLGTALAGRIPAYFQRYVIFLNLIPFTNRTNSIAGRLQNIFSEANLTQDHYNFFKDLAQAFNELVVLTCELVQDCCPDLNFPCHLMLHRFDNNAQIVEVNSRHHFYPSPVQNVQHKEIERVRLMYRRLLDLVYNFGFHSEAITSLKVTPSQTENFPLGERSMPYYYQALTGSANAMAIMWRPEMCCSPPLMSYTANSMDLNALTSGENPNILFQNYVQNPLWYNVNRHTLLRIEGHLGLEVGAVLSRLNAIREDHNLDFDVQCLQLNVATTDLGDLINNYPTDLQTGFNAAYLSELNEWMATRKELRVVCDLTTLQQDYLSVRSRLLVAMKEVQAHLQEYRDYLVTHEKSTRVTFDELLPNTVYSEASGQTTGQVIFNENNIMASIENFENGTESIFGNISVNLEASFVLNFLTLQNANLRLDFSNLPFHVFEIRFIFNTRADIDNISINELAIFQGSLRTGFEGINAEFDLETRFINESGQTGLAIVRFGEGIQSFVIGGQNLLIDNIWVGGQSISFPNEAQFQPRLNNLQALSDILEHLLQKDIKCFNYSVFQRVIKDFINQVIEIKLLFAWYFHNIDGDFDAFQHFPKWQDLVHCLNIAQYNAFYAQFTTIHSHLSHLLGESRPTFQLFAQQHTGMEHLAGVNPGGTFIIVSEQQNTLSGLQDIVVADFALKAKHCCCSVNAADIICWPIARHDYFIFEYEDTVETELSVLLNDVQPNGQRNLVLELEDIESRLGATLALGIESNSIAYTLNETIEGLDYFRYRLNLTTTDPSDTLTDIGHVHVLLLNRAIQEIPTTPVVETGTLAGRVVEVDKHIFLPNATVQVIDSAGVNILNGVTTEAGTFLFSVNAGTYVLQISHPNCYHSQTYSNITVPPNGNNEQTLFELTPRIPGSRQFPRDIPGQLITNTQLNSATEHTWTADTQYILRGVAVLNPGSTLTIEAGTIVRAEVNNSGALNSFSALVIAPGANLIVNGTLDEPVVFTSNNIFDDTPPSASDLWGGIFILGNDIVATPSFRDRLEGFPPFIQNELDYGQGVNSEFSLRVLRIRYLSIRYAGSLDRNEQPLSSFTLAGVSRSDTHDMRYIETFAGGGHGFSFLGGAVGIKNLVSAFNQGDAFFINQGYRGNGQFWFGIQGELSTSPSERILLNIFGAEDNFSDMDRALFSNPTILNSTLISTAQLNNLPRVAIRYRNFAAGNIVNSIITEFPQRGLEVQDVLNTDIDSYQRLREDEIRIANNIWWRTETNPIPAFEELIFETPLGENDISELINRLEGENNFLEFPPPLCSISRNQNSLALDPRLEDDFSDINFDFFNDVFFEQDAQYVGAFSSVGPLWLKCWTRLDELLYLPGSVNPPGFVNLDDLRIRVNPRLTDLRTQAADFSATIQPQLALTEDFVANKATDADLSADAFVVAYEQTVDLITTSMDTATHTERNQLMRLLHLVNHAYLDRVVIENPETPSETYMTALTTTIDKMKERNVSVNTTRNGWRSNDLRDVVGSNESIRTIRQILRN